LADQRTGYFWPIGIEMTINFLLCVLIAQLAFLTGETVGKKPDMQDRPHRSVVTIISLLGSISLGLLLFIAVEIIAALPLLAN
jgi:hypothetical protein